MDNNVGKKIEKIIHNVSNLPSMPFIVDKISEVVENKSSAAKDIAEVIAIDQSLTAKLLKLVNSSFFGFSSKITTVSRAIVVLGFQTVKTLALGVSVFKTARTINEEGTNFFDMEKFWEHSIGVAAGAKLIATLTGYKQLEEAFLAGLLHDIGKVIFVQYLPDEFEHALHRSVQEKISLRKAEQLILKVDHEVAGDYLSLRWKIPFQLRKVISQHHNPPLKDKDMDEDILKLIAIVNVANTLCKLNKIGFSGNSVITAKDEEMMQWLGIDESEITRFFMQIDSELITAKEFLGIITEQDIHDQMSDENASDNKPSVLILYKEHQRVLMSSLFLKQLDMNVCESVYEAKSQPWLTISNLKTILIDGLLDNEMELIRKQIKDIGLLIEVKILPVPFNHQKLLGMLEVESDPLLQDHKLIEMEDLTRQTVLLIDNKKDEILPIQRKLLELDYDAEILIQPENTIDTVQKLKPVLIILHIDLKEASALTLIKILQGYLKSDSKTKETKIMVISNYLNENIINTVTDLGILNILKKPFDMDVLLEKINVLLGNK